MDFKNNSDFFMNYFAESVNNDFQLALFISQLESEKKQLDQEWSRIEKTGFVETHLNQLSILVTLSEDDRQLRGISDHNKEKILKIWNQIRCIKTEFRMHAFFGTIWEAFFKTFPKVHYSMDRLIPDIGYLSISALQCSLEYRVQKTELYKFLKSIEIKQLKKKFKRHEKHVKREQRQRSWINIYLENCGKDIDPFLKIILYTEMKSCFNFWYYSTFLPKVVVINIASFVLGPLVVKYDADKKMRIYFF